MADKTLKRPVHGLRHPETHRAHSFMPGDDVPDWAAEQITNPAAWEEPERRIGAATNIGAPASDDGYPADGNIEDVLAWVGDDPSRAETALDREQQRDKPRSTLVEQLEAIANG